MAELPATKSRLKLKSPESHAFRGFLVFNSSTSPHPRTAAVCPSWSSPTVWLSQASFVEPLPIGLPKHDALLAMVQLYEASEGVSAGSARDKPPPPTLPRPRRPARNGQTLRGQRRNFSAPRHSQPASAAQHSPPIMVSDLPQSAPSNLLYHPNMPPTCEL